MMYPEHPAAEAMRQLVQAEDFVEVLRTKTDEELAELCVRQGFPRHEAAAIKTLSGRHGQKLSLLDARSLWRRHATSREILDAVLAAEAGGGLA